jgi:hypothetical protein
MSKSRAVKFAFAFGIALPFSLSSSTQAATIIGGSDLLSAGYATQMESWLGNDPTLSYSSFLAFTNIFDKGALDNSVTFHAAVDGRGPTFFVAEAKAAGSVDAFSIIGGFNPASWNSSGDYTYTDPATEAARTAFIFNLTLGDRRDQEIASGDTNLGYYQTANIPSYGPTFGGGHDIWVDSFLISGYLFQYSYCPDVNTSCLGTGTPNLLGHITDSFNNYENIEFGQLEVFTISNVSEVPLPAALPLFAAGLSVMGFMGWRRKRKAAVTGY